MSSSSSCLNSAFSAASFWPSSFRNFGSDGRPGGENVVDDIMADRQQPLRSAHHHWKLVQQAAVGRLHLCRILLTSWFGRTQGGSEQPGGQFYEEEDSAIGLCGCTKPTTTVAVSGQRSSWPASRLPVLSIKAWPSGSISSLCALKKSTPKMGKATSAKRNFQEKS